MSHRFLAAMILVLLHPAGANAQDCTQLRKAVGEARTRLRDCLAGGGGCAEEFKSVEAATVRAGDCPEAPRAVESPTPVAISECARKAAAADAAKTALRACIATGGDCAAELKAVETSLADLCSDSAPAAVSSSPAPGPTWPPATVDALVVLSDGTSTRGGLVSTNEGIFLVTRSGRIAVPLERIRRIEVGEQPRSLSSSAAAASTPVSLQGKYELGGAFSLGTRTSRVTIEGSSDHSDSTVLSISPFLGYFSTDNFEWLSGVSISRTASNYSDGSGSNRNLFGVGFGGSYLVRGSDSVFWGPYFFARYDLISSSSSDATSLTTRFDYAGPGGFLGGSMKTIVGAHGILTVTAGGYIDAYSLGASQGSIHVSGSDTEKGFETDLAFSVLF